MSRFRNATVNAVRLLFGSGDPLEPIEQDPDAVRDQACRLVSRDQSVCSPPDSVPPDTGSGGGGPNLDWLGTLLWLVFIALLVVLLVLLVRVLLDRSGRRRAKRKPKSEDDEDLDEVEQAAVAIDRSREPTNWRAEAEEHRRAGRYREALRCRYRALVGDLARRGVIDEIPGRTTGEERAQLRMASPVADAPFTSAADLFDEAWYGHSAVGAADDERFQSFERDVLAGALSAERKDRE